ncbi:uncharacterized protein [Haliotis cracherodii]|uniref:uncharacterized protein n=1 Tax=Haliotis cracherodii TaxID=6455 RepID=UPI0039E8BBF2
MKCVSHLFLKPLNGIMLYCRTLYSTSNCSRTPIHTPLAAGENICAIMKVSALVSVIGLVITASEAQFINVNLADELSRQISSGNVPMTSIGTDGVPSSAGSQAGQSPGTSSEQTSSTNGNSPLSVTFGSSSRFKNTVSFNSQTKKLSRKLKDMIDRMDDLENYFKNSGVYSPENNTMESTSNEQSFGIAANFVVPRVATRASSLAGGIPQMNQRIEDLKKAIADYKISNPAVEVTTNAGVNEGGMTTDAAFTDGTNTQFTDRIFSGYFDDDNLYDISGMAVSMSHDGIIYAANDRSSSRNLNDVYVVNATNGKVLNTIEVKGATNHDWEDMAVARCSATSKSNCIYIGDIGKGYDGRTSNKIYKIVEPDDPVHISSVDIEETISFSGISQDMETLMVSPDLKIYVIPEDDGEATLYKIENGRAMEMCQISLESEYEAPIGGDIASCGTKVLLKAVDYMYFYYVPDGNYEAALCDPNPKVHRLQYTTERNGQAVAFKPGGLSYYTCTAEEYSPLWRYDLLKVNEV